MNYIYLPAILLLMSLLSCQSPKPEGIERLDGSRITADSLTQAVHDLMLAGRVHGLGLSIFNDHKLVYTKAFGSKNVDKSLALSDSTNIYGASLSKAVFTVLVLKLVEEGVLDLDTPLESYLPKKIYEYPPQTRWHDDYSALKEDSLYHKITARMCLANTTGFPNWRWFEPDYKLRVKFEPGSKYGYAGEGFVYLQVVLEKMLGKGLVELADEKLFKPLGMARTSFKWQEEFEADYASGHSTKGDVFPKDIDNEARGASTMETTLKDYSRFLVAVLQQELLSAESWEEMSRLQLRIHSQAQFGPRSLKETTEFDHLKLGYGLGWAYIETPHGKALLKGGHGEGFQHFSVLFPKTGKGILMMTNSDNGEGIFKELLELGIADTYTPWKWLNYVPYQLRTD